MYRHLVCSILIFALVACEQRERTPNKALNLSEETSLDNNSMQISEENTDYISLLKNNPEYISKGFDFPVGKPNAQGYYNAQKFQENNHLGDDWNGVGGGNSDLGDPIYSVANGYVSEVKDYEGGWGKVVRIVHVYNDKLYESLYAHCDTFLVAEQTFIKKGAKIATIGNCNGHYLAHLHLEIRNDVDLDIGPGYSTNTKGYLDPTDFINKNRK